MALEQCVDVPASTGVVVPTSTGVSVPTITCVGVPTSTCVGVPTSAGVGTYYMKRVNNRSRTKLLNATLKFNVTFQIYLR